MGRRMVVAAGLLVAVAAGCAREVPRWRDSARMLQEGVRREGAEQTLPAEFRSVEELLVRGDSLLAQDEVAAADELYRFAWAKGTILETRLAAAKEKLAEERRKAEEEQELARKKARQEEEERASRKAERTGPAGGEKERPKKERPAPSHHTVRSGETLPQIASLPEIYGDPSFWPLLYRANRDQISDPKHISPGQVLRIPRNLTRDDIAEARRHGQERPHR